MFSEPAHVVTLLIGLILLMKKFAEMDRYHTLRVLILTLIFSCIVFYFFVEYGFTLGTPAFDCQPEHFCMTEM